MSQRHRDIEMSQMPPRQERRAAAHSERHRINVELREAARTASGGAEPLDVPEPGAAWKPQHHHDAEVAKSKSAKRGRTKRHWKTKMWKRRTQMRRERIDAWNTTRENPSIAGM